MKNYDKNELIPLTGLSFSELMNNAEEGTQFIPLALLTGNDIDKGFVIKPPSGKNYKEWKSEILDKVIDKNIGRKNEES